MALVLVATLMCPPSHALVSINDGKNQLYVVGSTTYAWDSNIFANAVGGADSVFSAALGIEFLRRAGMIGVNGSLFMDISQFVQNKGESFYNPRFRAEFTKATGRTTGSLTLGAARQSQADNAANVRNESWGYDAGLNLKYPVIERYTLSGSVGYALRDYVDNTLFVDLNTYSANLDIFYIYTSERDLVAGYRIRYSETSGNSAFADHAFTAGVSGKILPKLGGTLRAGFQTRVPSNRADEAFSGLTVSGSATWTLSKRMNASVQASKDYSTTSTNTSVDSTTLSVDFQYAMNSKVTLSAGLGYGVNDFLGVNGAGRVDTYFSWNSGAHYTFNDHVKLALTYAYFQNWSSNSYSNFARNSITLNTSSRF